MSDGIIYREWCGGLESTTISEIEVGYDTKELGDVYYIYRRVQGVRGVLGWGHIVEMGVRGEMGGAYEERERERERENMVERGYSSSRDRNLHGRFLVGIGNRWTRDDDGEDAVLHIRDNLLDLSSQLERQHEEERNGEGEQ